MNVQQLIAALNKIEDKSQTVQIAVRVPTQRYPVDFCNIFNDEYLDQMGGRVTLYVSLKEGMHVVNRNKNAAAK